MTSLTIKSLTKSYGDIFAVNNLNLDINDQELISLLGPSGCGKTTTLRSIAGFEKPDNGQILFDKLDVVGLDPDKRNIGMVFQNYALFPHMTVNQNLSFGLEMRKLSQFEINKRISELLETVQLTDMGFRYPNQLSGGQRQRVALARALIINPSILLLDEPLANLDAKLREEMRFFIRNLQKRAGITTIYVTHDQSEAMVISDRIVVMFNGSIHQVGTPKEIYNQPSTKEVADFIGLANFVKAKVKGIINDNEYNLETNIGDFYCKYNGNIKINDKVTLIIRPEALNFVNNLNNHCRNNFKANLKEDFFLGNFSGFKLVCSDNSEILVQSEPWRIFSNNEEIFLSFDHDKAWIIKD